MGNTKNQAYVQWIDRKTFLMHWNCRLNQFHTIQANIRQILKF